VPKPPKPPAWSAEHFSLANPRGPGQGDVPLLLRRVADAIGEYSPVEIQDLILHAEVNEYGSWPSVTVYFHQCERSSSTSG
jgi:hypothetical protein